MLLSIIIALVGAYLVGSIPTGYWFARGFFGVDVTKHGSGNIGATNVARVLGHVKYFFLIFFIDAGKTVATLWIIQQYAIVPACSGNQLIFLCAAAACLLLGNAFSIFLGGRGGKSVATLIGVVVFLYPLSVVGVMLVSWAVVFFISRQVFFASIVASIAATVFYWVAVSEYENVMGVFLIAATAWLIWRHKSNIKKFFAKGS